MGYNIWEPTEKTKKAFEEDLFQDILISPEFQHIQDMLGHSLLNNELKQDVKQLVWQGFLYGARVGCNLPSLDTIQCDSCRNWLTRGCDSEEENDEGIWFTSGAAITPEVAQQEEWTREVDKQGQESWYCFDCSR